MPRPLLLLLLAACDPTTGQQGEQDPLTVISQTLPTDHGLARLEIDVGRNVGAFMVVGSGDDYLAVSAIYDPSGAQVMDWYDWYYSPRNLTMAVWFLEGQTVLNWPVREQDTPLSPGVWVVDLEISKENGSYPMGVDIPVTVLLKEDSDFTTGKLRARVVYASGLGADPGTVAAVEGAVARWQEIYATYGLRLQVSYDRSELDPRLPHPSSGDPQIQDIAAETDEGSITLIVGDTIAGSSGILGESGNIPGALVASPTAAIGLALNNHKGGDGVFNDEEARLLGGTMAHEVGHYLGLFHPVESTWTLWDALDDTPECSDESGCLDALGENLMFFSTICGIYSCLDQDNITPAQQGVLQRSVALR